MAKILFSVFSNVQDLNNTALDSFYKNFINALVKYKNEVWVLITNGLVEIKNDNNLYLNVSDKDRIVEVVKNFNPDLIISPNHEIPLDILNNTDCQVAVYTADSPIYVRNRDYIKSHIERYTFLHGGWHNVFSEACVKMFGATEEQNFYIGHVTAVQSREQEQQNNIAFIGTVGWPQLVKEKINLFSCQKEFDDFWKRLEQTSGDASTWDMGFCHVLTSNNRIKTLDAICDLGLSIYGIPYNIFEAVGFSYQLVKCFKYNQVTNVLQMENVLNSAKISPNLYNAQAVSGLSWRVADVMASNACLISPYKTDLDLISPYVKIPTFETPTECRELCIKLLKDNKWREDIVRGCHKAVNDFLTYEKWLKNISDVLGIKLQNIGKGKVEYIVSEVKENKYCTGVLRCQNFSDKLRYKIWKHLGKMLRRKGILK